MNSRYDLNPEDPQSKRSKSLKYTCFVIANICLLGCLLYALLPWNNHNLNTLNYPSNSYGQVCQLQYAQAYPYVYVNFAPSTPKLHCVSECPSAQNGFTILDSRGALIAAPGISETANYQLGGICLSNQTLSLMKKRGLYSQI